VRELNEDPLNVAAKKWLPEGWGTDANLYILTLMLWGVWEAATVPDYWDTLDIAGEQVANLTRANPALAMAMLRDRRYTGASGEELRLTAASLDEQADAAGAAWASMSALASALREDAEPS
jgi:hypothetical protein